MIHAPDLLVYVVRPTLKHLAKDSGFPHAHSVAAEQLVLATILHESTLGGTTYLDQVDREPQNPGPARGIGQMEAPTHASHRSWLNGKASLRTRVLMLLPSNGAGFPGSALEALHGNLYYASAMTRIHYLRVPERLPPVDDAELHAAYWGAHYQTQSDPVKMTLFTRTFTNRVIPLY